MRKLSLSLLLIATISPWFLTTLLPQAMAAAAPSSTAPSGSSSVPRALLAHGDSHGDVHRFWIARVVNVPADGGAYEQTQFWNTTGFGDPWAQLPPISSRAVSLASNAGELFVVLSNGQCMIVDEGDNRLAPGLPQGDTMLAIANDQDALWAVMIPKVPSTAPSSTQADALPASTLPSIQAALTGPRQLVAYRFDTGKWVDPRNLPLAASEPLPTMSMAVVDRRPMIAWQTPDYEILVSQLQRDDQWSKPKTVASNKNGVDFKLLSVAGRAILWTSADVSSANATSAGATTTPSASQNPTAASTRPSAGTLYMGENFSKVMALPIRGTPPAHGVQTIAVAFGSLRWLASDDDKQPPFEQAYTLDGQPEGEAASISATTTDQIPLQPFVVGALALVLVATGSAMMQRRLPSDEPPAPRAAAKPVLAPLGVRFAAGVVDLLPILAVGLLWHRILPQGVQTAADWLLLQNIIILAIVTYIAHTLAAELICGQSMGKMLLGLRVCDLDGQPASHVAIALRNLLRVVDFTVLPLLLVIFSAQQQRVGDLAGGTIVVIREPDPQVQEQE
jgi:uncharacterized RDD family membrane protein YckC